jgi:hypothetical protein
VRGRADSRDGFVGEVNVISAYMLDCIRDDGFRQDGELVGVSHAGKESGGDPGRSIGERRKE